MSGDNIPHSDILTTSQSHYYRSIHTVACVHSLADYLMRILHDIISDWQSRSSPSAALQTQTFAVGEGPFFANEAPASRRARIT